jgi:hypothetical protein
MIKKVLNVNGIDRTLIVADRHQGRVRNRRVWRLQRHC